VRAPPGHPAGAYRAAADLDQEPGAREILAPPVPDLFGTTGQHWLSRQDLPADEQVSVRALLWQLDFRAAELAAALRSRPCGWRLQAVSCCVR
jgi:hypothetical protein